MSADRDTTGPSAYSASAANSVMGHDYLGRLGMRQMLKLRGVNHGERVPADPNLTRRRPLYVIAVVLMLASVLAQYPPIFICGLLLLGIAVVPELWYRYGLRGLLVAHEMEVGRAAFGSIATIPLMIENRKLLPLPMVETVDEFPEDLTVLGARLGLSTRPGSALLTRTLRLWAYQRLRRRYYVRAIQRGAYTFGPTTVRVTDPFGILTREETIETRRSLLVHPLIAPLERLDLTPTALFGDHASQVRLLEDPLRVAGVRDYAPGDDPRRVHWKATARLGSLQSKVLDPSTQRTMVIALDIRTFSRAQMGYDPDLAELAIATAASVASWATTQGYAVGLIANGAIANITPETSRRPEPGQHAVNPTGVVIPRLRLEPSARPEQLTRILDSLARLRLFGGLAMGPLLAEEMRSAPAGAILVYVGLESLVDVGAIVALRRIRSGGRGVSLVLTARDSDDPLVEDEEAHALRGAGLPVHIVGGRTRWRMLAAEAFGAVSPRAANEVASEEHLRSERALIDSQRKARMNRQIHTAKG
ncbi:MAG TPA: DUF58 domain-containing protein [Ktedonobacterales bacterium]|nr:DUF58 domain-containing protein [Ktedonobacterales bacterium]